MVFIFIGINYMLRKIKKKTQFEFLVHRNEIPLIYFIQIHTASVKYLVFSGKCFKKLQNIFSNFFFFLKT